MTIKELHVLYTVCKPVFTQAYIHTNLHNKFLSWFINLYDQFCRTELKHFLDGLGDDVNDIPSSAHGGHQWSNGVTLSNGTNTHL